MEIYFVDVSEQADDADLKSAGVIPWGFKSLHPHYGLELYEGQVLN